MLLYGLSYSPWTHRVRWALAHHGIAVDYREHVPMLGELPLRARARRWSGRVTVPLLVDGATTIMGSFDIVEHVERDRAQKLIEPASRPAILGWNERAERIMEAGRALIVAKTAESAAALREALPGFVPSSLRGALTPLARTGTGFFRRKYGLDRDLAAYRAIMTAEYAELRRALGAGPHLLEGRLTHADIVMALALSPVRPPDARFVRLGPATREVWSDAPLAEQFPDLLAWRDEVMTSHWPVAPSPSAVRAND